MFVRRQVRLVNTSSQPVDSQHPLIAVLKAWRSDRHALSTAINGCLADQRVVGVLQEHEAQRAPGPGQGPRSVRHVFISGRIIKAELTALLW